ncbi:MBL fold metallo-hydrolase [Flavihumibacter rivuli]|uniref:MBL fold metallo-hydrolase n=1 Tax=Flavihumibacter rivuli TaxID=2838156 RepID=UPI001BDF542A|nr:MBL fold metallo-hydrolase [Flavihumibacter rivuli]ULQ57811.1 MBL fold metallo-hydrolase [Flavihumibacter rivuli]
MNTIHILSIPFQNAGKEDRLYPVILVAGEDRILLDCGYEGFLPLLEEALGGHGLSLKDLTGVFITHHDIDHMGALFELKSIFPSIKVFAPEKEVSYISGKAKSLRLQQAEELFEQMPPEHREWALGFQEMLKSMKTCEVDVVVQPGEDILPGFKVLATPGHMPGHVSLYHEASGTIIAADAVVLEDGMPEIANPAFTLDLPEAVRSVRQLAALPSQKIICYHGGSLEGNIPGALLQLVERYEKNS